MMPAITADERSWRAEHDLHTLIEAEKIKNDPKRFKAAMARKKALAKELASIGDGKGKKGK